MHIWQSACEQSATENYDWSYNLYVCVVLDTGKYFTYGLDGLTRIL